MELPQNSHPLRRSFRKIGQPMAKHSAKIHRPEHRSRNINNSLDTSLKPGRGRPAKVESSLIVERANHFHGNLARVWNTLGPLLTAAESETDIARAFETGANPYIGPIVWPALFPLVLEIVHDPKYPKARSDAQARFLAESLAGWGEIAPRSARDICGRARNKARPTRILRYEFHIECSCGYSGLSRDHACPSCDAKIPWEEEENF